MGWSKGKVATAAKIPVDAARTGNAVHLFAQFTFKRRNPGYKLEAKAIVDHGKAPRGKRQTSAIDSRNGLAHLGLQVRQTRLLGEAASSRIELAITQRLDQIAAKRDLISVPAGKTLLCQHL